MKCQMNIFSYFMSRTRFVLDQLTETTVRG